MSEGQQGVGRDRSAVALVPGQARAVCTWAVLGREAGTKEPAEQLPGGSSRAGRSRPRVSTLRGASESGLAGLSIPQGCRQRCSACPGQAPSPSGWPPSPLLPLPCSCQNSPSVCPQEDRGSPSPIGGKQLGQQPSAPAASPGRPRVRPGHSAGPSAAPGIPGLARACQERPQGHFRVTGPGVVPWGTPDRDIGPNPPGAPHPQGLQEEAGQTEPHRVPVGPARRGPQSQPLLQRWALEQSGRSHPTHSDGSETTLAACGGGQPGPLGRSRTRAVASPGLLTPMGPCEQVGDPRRPREGAQQPAHLSRGSVQFFT